MLRLSSIDYALVIETQLNSILAPKKQLKD